jgi:hypoxanthine phosphoribosyltransferase
VDDINDSGITFSDVVDNIVENNDVDQTKIKTVSLWTRYSSNFRVDHTVNTIDNDDWIVFPWEQEK